MFTICYDDDKIRFSCKISVIIMWPTSFGGIDVIFILICFLCADTLCFMCYMVWDSF